MQRPSPICITGYAGNAPHSKCAQANGDRYYPFNKIQYWVRKVDSGRVFSLQWNSIDPTPKKFGLIVGIYPPVGILHRIFFVVYSIPLSEKYSWFTYPIFTTSITDLFVSHLYPIERAIPLPTRLHIPHIEWVVALATHIREVQSGTIAVYQQPIRQAVRPTTEAL